jgi:hypothetical protein
MLYFVGEHDMIHAANAVLFEESVAKGGHCHLLTTFKMEGASHVPNIDAYEALYHLLTCWMDMDMNDEQGCTVQNYDFKQDAVYMEWDQRQEQHMTGCGNSGQLKHDL